MNVTELARKLRVPTKQLLEKLPAMGFDIGKRAIKVDDRVAKKIMYEWPRMVEQWEAERRVAEKEELVAETKKAGGVLILPAVITVRELAVKTNLPVTKIMGELMKNGILASVNERLDYETAAVVAGDFGFEVTAEESMARDEEKIVSQAEKLEALIQGDKNTVTRPPVVVIMGHVDHGKTKLLDYIRQENVAAGEAGGITQHIGAYQADKNGKKITFIDTPGHEAFTAMRSRGAKTADLAILVVAADDSVQPQTVEAMKIIKASELPFVVAINKIDKEAANLDRVKQDLSKLDLIPEDWGGKTVMVPVSAMTGEGVDNLLEMVLLVAEMEKEHIKANPERRAIGTVIESKVDKDAGPVATVLIQSGTLRPHDYLSVDETQYGKVKTMSDWQGRELTSAPPSTPVRILGFKAAPFVGDIVEAVGKDKYAKLEKKMRTEQSRREKLASVRVTQEEGEEVKKVNLIVKTDVLGSLEAIMESLNKIVDEEVKINVVSRGLGNVTDAEVLQAEATGSFIAGFNVKLTPGAQSLAQEKGVAFKNYNIIYEFLDDVKAKLTALLGDNEEEVEYGQLKVAVVFKQTADHAIVGGKVLGGKIIAESRLKVLRGGQTVGEGALAELQSGKEKVKEVRADEECGIKFDGRVEIQAGDILVSYVLEKKARQLGK